MNTGNASPLKVAIIGCGRPRGAEGATGFAMGHRHMAGYEASGRVDLPLKPGKSAMLAMIETGELKETFSN
jgi:predicted dehydrogenase